MNFFGLPPLVFRLILLLAGALLAYGFLRLGRRMSPRREKRLYVTALIVMQVIYLGFAMARPAGRAVVQEGVVLTVFTLIALAGSRYSSRFLPLGYLAHGAWDLRHLILVAGYVLPGYPELCVGFDWLLFFYVLRRAPEWDRAAKEVQP